MRLYLIIIIQLVLLQSILIQKISGQWIRKNAIYLEAETMIIFGNASINYERIFLPEKSVHLGVSAGFGRGYIISSGTSEWDRAFSTDHGFAYKIKGYFFLDCGFEIGAGYTFINEQGWRVFNWPSISFGYRSNDTPLLTKAYFGTWGFGISIGYSF